MFLGVARNCAAFLPGVLKNLELFSTFYDRAAFVFVVSDSSDSTAALLDAWGNARRTSVVVDLGKLKDRLPKRTSRLAYVRNIGLAELRRRGWSDYGHLIVTDLDNVMRDSVPIAGFLSAANWLDEKAERAGIFANSSPRYYDIWALRHDTWCPADCWHAIWKRGAHETFHAAKMREVHDRQIVLPSWLAPIPVRSAFGGLGIYKLNHVKAADYEVIDDAEFESSEHVQFNEKIANGGGTLHVFPNLVVHAPPEHLFQAAEMPYYLQLRRHRLEFDEARQLDGHDRFRFLYPSEKAIHGKANVRHQEARAPMLADDFQLALLVLKNVTLLRAVRAEMIDEGFAFQSGFDRIFEVVARIEAIAELPFSPAASGEALVAAVYHKIVERLPDAEGAGFWRRQLAQGTVTRGALFLSVVQSTLLQSGSEEARRAAAQQSIADCCSHAEELAEMIVKKRGLFRDARGVMQRRKKNERLLAEFATFVSAVDVARSNAP